MKSKVWLTNVDVETSYCYKKVLRKKALFPDIIVTNKAELNLCNSFNWKYCYFCSGAYECDGFIL